MGQNKTETELIRSLSSEYVRGFNDALYDRGCRPTSLEYVAGYEQGLETKQIGNRPSHG